jgi:hypothetical protein
MNKKETATVVISCAVTLVLILAFESMYPDKPATCADGWQSPSIGLQGACSHHGGVKYYGDQTPWYLIALSLAAGFGTFVSLANAFSVFQAPPASPPPDADVELVLAAIKNGKRIKFQYLKRGESVSQLREVTPSRIKFIVPGRPSTRCVIGRCHKANDTRTFTLSRMSDITIT